MDADEELPAMRPRLEEITRLPPMVVKFFRPPPSSGSLGLLTGNFLLYLEDDLLEDDDMEFMMEYLIHRRSSLSWYSPKITEMAKHTQSIVHETM